MAKKLTKKLSKMKNIYQKMEVLKTKVAKILKPKKITRNFIQMKKICNENKKGFENQRD